MDIWQVLGTPQIAEITAVVSIIVSVSLAQKPSPSKKKKMDIDSCCHLKFESIYGNVGQLMLHKLVGTLSFTDHFEL